MAENKQAPTLPTWEAPKTLWNKMFISIFFANLVMNTAVKMSNASLSLFAKDLGAPADEIGILMSMFAYTALIFRFIAGPTMNSFNRKKIVICAMAGFGLVYLGYALSPNIAAALGLEVITVLKFFRLLQGIANAFGNACCMAIVADVLPKESFSTGMGIYGCTTIIANAFGPAIGSAARKSIGVVNTYFVTVVIMCIAILLATQVKVAPREKVKFKITPKNMIAKEALLPTFIYFLLSVGYAAANAFLLVYDEERGVAGASLYFTAYSFAQLVTRPLVGKLADKYGFVKVTIPSAVLTAVSLLMVAYADSLPLLLLAGIVSALGFGGFQPVVQGLSIKAVGPERRGSATSTNFIGLDLSSIIAPTICGYVASITGYVPAMWYAMCIFIVLGLICTIVFAKKLTRIETDFLAKQTSESN
ncbi:MAG: MFS transporter [Oscillospiraceae bacterium]